MSGDLRYAMRVLRKNPGFAVVAVLALTLGIGANTAIFTVINALVLRPLPYREADNLVLVYERRPQQGRERGVVSGPDFVDWRRDNPVFSSMDGWLGWIFNLTGDQEPERVSGALASAGFFDTLGVQAALGRTFRPEEARTEPAVVVLSHGLWQRRFGADPQLVGKPVTLNGRPFQVIGILPAAFHFYASVNEMWVPMDMGAFDTNRGSHFLNVVARLKPGVTVEQAQAEMIRIAGGLEQQYPEKNRGHSANVLPLRSELVPAEAKKAFPVMLGAVGFVLLIACANVANLLLARGATRHREVAIRAALGAGRARLVRQLLTESVLLALAGGLGGVLLAQWGTQFLAKAIPPELALAREIQIDMRVLGFALLLSVVTGVVFGLLPAWRAVSGGEWAVGSRVVRGKLSGVLVVTEVALSVMLLAGAGLMLRSLFRIMTADPGFRRERVLTFQLATTRARYPGSPQVVAFYQQFLARVRALPGVEAAGAVSLLPLSGQLSGRNFRIEGGAAPPTFLEQYNARPQSATPDYFRAMGIPLLKGRLFTAADTRESPWVTVINQTMARRYWPDEDPLGKSIFVGGEHTREIVGVIGDVKHQSLTGDPTPEMVFPHTQETSGAMNVVVRTRADPLGILSAVKAELQALDRDMPLSQVRTMEEVTSASAAQPRILAALLAVFAAMAVLLAAVGIYGVMSYAVERRTQEIGIRMALGAERRDVLAMVVRQGMTLAGIGVGIGLAGGFLAREALGGLLFGIRPNDPLTYIGVTVALLAVAMAANYIPAHRATRVDPMEALRYE